MGYVEGFENDIFVSYWRHENKPDLGEESGWVTKLKNRFENQLKTELGTTEVGLWMDHQLEGEKPLEERIVNRAQNSAALLVILSRGYLNSKWCERERTAFLESCEARGRKPLILLVEKTRIEQDRRPEDLRNLGGYQFWYEDADSRRVREAKDDGDQYWSAVDDLVQDAARALTELKASPGGQPHSENGPVAFLAEARSRSSPPAPAQEQDATPFLGATPPQVFVSYSHEDEKWVQRLKKVLKPLQEHAVMSLWDDTKIRPGEKWEEGINRALTSCSLAILLISENFVASDFIVSKELPPLLDAARRNGVRLLCVAVSDALYDRLGIGELQWLNNPKRPLNRLRGPDRNRELVEIARKIETLLKESS